MMMLSQVTRLRTCTSIGVEVDRVRVHAVVRDLPDLRPVVAVAIGVTFTSALGRFVVSMSSVDGKTYGMQDDVLQTRGGRDDLQPRFACIRPNSSKFDEFISSWIAFGSSGIDSFDLPCPSSSSSACRR